MSAVEYYNHSTYPATGAAGSSASLRSELELIEAGFGKLPDLSGNGSKLVAVNSGATGLEAISALTVAQGGTGRATSTTAYALLAAGTTATGAHQTLAAGATTEILVGGGASALPVWTTATGTGAPVRADSPTLITPALGTPSALVGTNITGTAASLTAGNVTTNANLTGHITSVGNAAVLGSFTMAQLDAAVSDGNVIYSGQALGTPSSGTLTNCSGTAASLTAGNVTTNANLTGHVTSSGNAAVLGSFTFAQLNTAVSDAEVARTDAANTFTGTQTFSNLIAAAAGSVGAPSIYMTGYATTGWYNIGANNWGFAVSGAKVLDIASTGLAIAGTLSASGTTTLARVNQSNGSIDFSSLGNGSTSWQIGTQTALKPLDIFTGGVVRAQFSDTGLAVTGLLTPTISGTGVYFSGGDSTVSRRLEFSTTTTTNTGDTQKINALGTTGVLVLQANSSNIATVSSTGLAVTGALSATGALTLSGTGQVLIATAASAADKYVTISNTNGTLEYGVLAGGEGFIGTSTADNLKLQVNGSVVGNLSSTGLAVTGALSATGLIGGRSSNGQAFTTTNGVDADFSITLASGDVQLINTVGSSKISTVINGTARTQVSSTGLAVTGAISATGTSSLARIDQSNGSIDFASLGNGSTSWQIGTQTAGKPLDLFIGGSVIATVSTTGLAVTGTIGATSTLTSAVAAGSAAFTMGAAARFYLDGSVDTFITESSGNNIQFVTGGSAVVNMNTTGLAVTGAIVSTSASLHALSPLGAQAATRLYLSSADQTSATYGLAVGDSSGNSALVVKGDRSVVLGANIATVSSTGLAVTGTLSATGTSSLARIDQSNGSINFASLGNGSTSWQIGTVTAGKPLDIFIGGAVIAQFSDTGLAVTGALTLDGNVLGTREILQNSKSAAYTTVLGDAGKHILHPSADTTARTFTIDSNANVAYPVGTAITFVNQASAGVMTISITSDTMRLAGAGTTGSRTLAANGIATALKITTTEWIISGTGLT